ncbi:exodeoxyribonuclease VII large subunit [Thermodesulfobacteriota bacterium]
MNPKIAHGESKNRLFTMPSNLIQTNREKVSNQHIRKQIYTVSELTSEIKDLLEEKYPFVWISGEISNFKIPVSGHFYLTLKDEDAQINAVMFRGQNRNLKFSPEDGMSVTGMGRISLYEPRGTYQIILEYLEPEGVGAIQMAFEQLKARLSDEGLFDEKHKTPLPFLPSKISIITSPTGAVVHDIIQIVTRRFSTINIEILPVKVQGEGAVSEIVSALKALNTFSDADVAILARGGGSLEDFHAFNSEDVARSIFSSEIPVISAVGHEIDFTIADFVADLRAPTASAAAEFVVPLKDDLVRRCTMNSVALRNIIIYKISQLRNRLNDISNRLKDPKKRIHDLRMRTDDYTLRLTRIFTNKLQQRRERLVWRIDKLYSNNPFIQIKKINEELEQKTYKFLNNMNIYISTKHSALRELTAKLHALSPVAILSRGYSITRTIPDATVVTDSRKVHVGQDLEVMVAKGALCVNVQSKNNE